MHRYYHCNVTDWREYQTLATCYLGEVMFKIVSWTKVTSKLPVALTSRNIPQRHVHVAERIETLRLQWQGSKLKEQV